MHWYLVYTKPRQEKIALQNLQQQGYDCYLPTLPMEYLRRGTLAVTEEALFPRYLFVQLGLSTDAKSWAPIRSTKGVSRLVTFGSHPAQVSEALIQTLKARETALASAPIRLFNAGDTVKITEGPFAGIEGIYQMPDGERRVMVLFELMCQTISLAVSPSSVRKVG